MPNTNTKSTPFHKPPKFSLEPKPFFEIPNPQHPSDFEFLWNSKSPNQTQTNHAKFVLQTTHPKTRENTPSSKPRRPRTVARKVENHPGDRRPHRAATCTPRMVRPRIPIRVRPRAANRSAPSPAINGAPWTGSGSSSPCKIGVSACVTRTLKERVA